MKFCPTCQTRYDEEILRFCTKDGTPLAEENQPVFTELPSRSADADDFGEETVIRRNPPKVEQEIVEQTQPLSSAESEQPQTAKPRIVIPTSQPKTEPLPPPIVAAPQRTTTVYQTAPRAKSNAGKIVALTLLGTFLILGSIAALYLMTRDNSDNPNQNANVAVNVNSINLNLNTNSSIENPSNFNGLVNLSNANASANIKTPTPTPKPSPSATAQSLANTNANIGFPSPTPRPSQTPTPIPSPTAATPRPSPSPTIPPPPPPPPSNRPVNAGVLNGRAVNLPKPAYPPVAKQMRAAGQVAVQIQIDESGNVTAARATTGNALLRLPAEAAARQSKINPVVIDNRAVKATGILLYNFINN